MAGVHLFPWPLFAGDHVSLDVDPRLPGDVSVPLTLTVGLASGEVLTATVAPDGLDSRYQARLYWAWQLPSLSGTEQLTLTLHVPPGIPDPDLSDNVLIVPVNLLSLDALVPPEPGTRWTSAETTGFRLYYLTGTAAERDLTAIIAEARAAYADVTAHFAPGDALVDIYLLDRVIGQGGYASSEWVAISYTNRQYTPVNLGMVLRHELVHRLDNALGCDAGPSLLREGLAVYVSGGHYVVESVPHKAAAIRLSSHFIPLERLVDDFYTHQHEVSYIEAGALVTYVVDAYGWEGLETLCRATARGEEDRSDGQLLEAGLQALVGAELTAFGTRWEMWLDLQLASPQDVERLAVELRLMDTLRAYQVAYDLGAHFLEGILFSPKEGTNRDITADFVRRPRSADAVALEVLLVMAQAALRYDTATATPLLDAVEDALSDGFPDVGLAADVKAIVAAALAKGYEPYRLLERADGGYEVHALAYADWPAMSTFEAVYDGVVWSLRDIAVGGQ